VRCRTGRSRRAIASRISRPNFDAVRRGPLRCSQGWTPTPWRAGGLPTTTRLTVRAPPPGSSPATSVTRRDPAGALSGMSPKRSSSSSGRGGPGRHRQASSSTTSDSRWRDAASAAAALPHARPPAARRRRRRAERGLILHGGRIRWPVPVAAVRGRAVRRRPAARYRDALPILPITSARRSSKPSDGLRGAIPALRVRGHGDGEVPARYRGTPPDSPAAAGGTSMGACTAGFGLAVSERHGRGGRPRLHPTQIAGRNRMWRRMMIATQGRFPTGKAAIIRRPAPGPAGPRSSSCSPPGSAPLVRSASDPAETRPMP